MIPGKIQALFDFIDYLDKRKIELVNKYLPLCDELGELNNLRSELKPRSNYLDKKKYDELQRTITEKFQPITKDIYIPVLNRLKELKIWSGDETFTSIWNHNISAIHEFKEIFETEDIEKVISYKRKYLLFRKETNSDFLCLQLVFSSLDELYKELFDFFKDTSENEFESFETKTVQVKSMAEVVKGLSNNKGENVRYSLPYENFFDYQNVNKYLPQQPTIKNEIVMGDKIQVGDITNNSGQIIIGKDIKLFDSLHGKNEAADKISELIELIRKEEDIDVNRRQTIITNFDKIKEELFEEQPSKFKIHKWLTNTKEGLEKLVLSHDVVQALEWIYKNFNFIVP